MIVRIALFASILVSASLLSFGIDWRPLKDGLFLHEEYLGYAIISIIISFSLYLYVRRDIYNGENPIDYAEVILNYRGKKAAIKYLEGALEKGYGGDDVREMLADIKENG